MKCFFHSFALLIVVLLPFTSSAYEVLAEGVYLDGSTMYISNEVTSLGHLQVSPTEIYSYATIPPACVSNTFTDYNAVLHVTTSAMVSYFSSQYWNFFVNIVADAVEPDSVIVSKTNAEVMIGQSLSLAASVIPSNAKPNKISWYSTNTSIATVNDGIVTTVAPGGCDIIAWCAGKQAVCHITVLTERITITLDKHNAYILPNHLLNLTATCSPMTTDLTVWSSDNTVALPRLVNGTIQVLGLKEGTATITVGSNDGTANTDACVVTVYTEIGDVNSDGYVSIADVTALIDYLLCGDAGGFKAENADTNRDGNISIADVTMMIDYLLSGIWPWKKETFIVNGISFTMVAIDGGTFIMGAANDDGEAFDREYPAHQVTLSSYSIGQTEVTQALWQAVMGDNPSHYKGDLNRPVESVSWVDCQEFISKLNQMTGRVFRLPSEAEWEFAARGGNNSQSYKYAGSNNIDDVAWYDFNAGEHLGFGNSDYGTHQVAMKEPNELGLFDMSGNVNEWCQDWYGPYGNETQINPMGPSSGDYRVIRGGSYVELSRGCRVSNRYKDFPMSNYDVQGLRLAL